MVGDDMLKKIISLVILLLFFFPMLEAKEEKITSTGTGSTRDLAILNAVENAVRQFNGVSIQKTAPTQAITLKQQARFDAEHMDKKRRKESISASANLTSKVILEEVNAKYSGKVDSYEITDEKKDGEVFKVTILATFKTLDKYQSSKLSNKKDYSLAIPVLYSKQNYLCSSGKTDKLLDDITFDLKEKISETQKFKLLDRQNFSAYAQELSLVAAGATPEEEKKRLQSVIAADYVLIGNIRQFSFEKDEETLELLGEVHTHTHAKLSVEFSLLEIATMENVFTTQSSVSFDKEDSSFSCDGIFHKLSGKVARDVTEKLLKKFFPQEQQVKKKKTVNKRPYRNQKKAEETTRPIVKLPFDK